MGLELESLVKAGGSLVSRELFWRQDIYELELERILEQDDAENSEPVYVDEEGLRLSRHYYVLRKWGRVRRLRKSLLSTLALRDD